MEANRESPLARVVTHLVDTRRRDALVVHARLVFEHRLFSEISKNWAGRPLDSYETVLKYLRTTETSTGLKVKAYLAPNYYPKGVRISNKQMATLRIQEHDTQPKRNYTLRPA